MKDTLSSASQPPQCERDILDIYRSEIPPYVPMPTLEQIQYAQTIQTGKLATALCCLIVTDAINNNSSSLISPLMKLIEQGVEARQIMIERNLSLVIKEALTFRKTHMGMEIEDIIQAGNEGLIMAVDKYNPNPEFPVRLATCARFWIRKYLYRSYIASTQVPEHVYYAENNVRRTSALLTQQNGSVPDEKEIADKMLSDGSTKSQRALAYHRGIVRTGFVSLEDCVDHRGEYREEYRGRNDLGWHNIFPSPDNTEEEAIRDVAREQLRRFFLESVKIILLPEERQMLYLRFGFNGCGESLSLSQLGKKYGLTKEAIRLRLDKILQKLIKDKEFYELLQEFS